MQSTKFSSFLKYLAYVIEILVIHIISITPNVLPEIYGGKPTFLIVIALTISVFEREISAMIIGLICGLLIDISFSTGVGTFTISLTIICFILGYVANNLIVANIWNTLLGSLIIVIILFSLHFVFTYLLKDYGEAKEYFINHYIARIVLTFIFTPVFYFLNKFIHARLSNDIN